MKVSIYRALVPCAVLTLASFSAALAGDVSGVVKFEGERPKRKVVKMNADPNCMKIHGDKKIGTEDAIVSKDMEVKNAFVYLKNVSGSFDAPAEPVEINQEGCLYSPHVLAVHVGQTLNIRNSDNTLHNVHALPKENPEFNFGQPSPGVRDRTFRKAEVGVKFKCDVHPWMGAWVHVMEHPFHAVTGDDGAFTIKNVPAGKYTLVSWHEVFGSVEQEIEVGADGKSGVSFTMKEK